MKKAYPLIISVVLMLTLIMARASLEISGTISGQLNGFALDSQGNFYLGIGEQVCLLTDGEVRNLFRLPIKQSFRFFIEDDKLIAGAQEWGSAKIYDLSGQYISDSKLSFREVNSVANSGKIVERDGSVYEYIDHFGFKPAEIRVDGETVYRVSMLEFLLTGPAGAVIMLLVGGVFTFNLLLFLFYRHAKWVE